MLAEYIIRHIAKFATQGNEGRLVIYSVAPDVVYVEANGRYTAPQARELAQQLVIAAELIEAAGKEGQE